MKKISAVILAVVMLFTLAACGGKTNDGDSSAGKNKGGKTEAVEVLVGFYINGEIDRTFDYDSNGNIILDITGDPDGNYYSRSTWTYDDDNRLVSRTDSYRYDDYEESRTDYTYDENGNLSLETHSNGNRVEYSNDENGNCVEELGISSEGNVHRKVINEFDSQGRCTLKTYYNSDGSMDYKKSYEYDEHDRVICEIRTEEDGEDDKYVYKYDSDGERIRTESYTNGVKDREYGYELDAQTGVRLKYFEHDFADVNTEHVYTYDENGNIIRSDKYEFFELTEYTIYEYDSLGREINCERFNTKNGKRVYSETSSYTDAGLYLQRVVTHGEKTETVDYEYKTIEVPAERAELVREMQMEFDP